MKPVFTAECEEVAIRPWAVGKDPGRRLRLFHDPFVEFVIFRGHPALPYLVVAVLVGLLLEHHAVTLVERPLTTAALLGVGIVVWTLVEYGMHRWLFHLRPRTKAGQCISFVVHGHHHYAPAEELRLAATPVQMLSMLGLLWGVFTLCFGPNAPAAWIGGALGYVFYEWVHYAAHHGTGLRWLSPLTDHHRAHHRGDGGRWGISSPLWDWVFRTLP